jgi:hypothetical protein
VYTKPFNVDSAGARAVIKTYPDNPMSSTDRTNMINEAIALVRNKAESDGNTVLDSREAVGLTAPFNLNAPNFLPAAGSPALSGASFADLMRSLLLLIIKVHLVLLTGPLAGPISIRKQLLINKPFLI